MKEFVGVIAMMTIGALILFKSDQQSVIILRGKCHRLGIPQDEASAAYRKHLKRSSLVQSVIGMGALALAIASWVSEWTEAAIILGVIGVALLGLAICGRVKTFLAADQELTG